MWEILRVCAVYRYFVDKGILRTRELSLDLRYASEKEGTSFLIKLKELAILYVKSGEFIIFPLVHLPTLWWRIDVAGNCRRYPADTEAEKDQQGALRVLATPDYLYEYQSNRPSDGEASTVGPIVSNAKHLLPPVPFEEHDLQLLVCTNLDDIAICYI